MSGPLGEPTTEVRVALVRAPELGPAVGALGVLVMGCFANKLLLLLILDSII